MAFPAIEEQKWSSLSSVYLQQMKNYPVQNLEFVKKKFLIKIKISKAITFFRKKTAKFYSKLKI